jgi:hypothetical protein
MIIGLVGWIGGGKGTTADILVKSHGFIKESFANSVKDAVSVIFGWDREMLEGSTLQSREWRETPDKWWSGKFGKPFSPRMALQIMGTEAGRNSFDKNIWIYSLLARCDSNKKYVIADVRFPNEMLMIKESGGKVYRVQRGPLPEWFPEAVKLNRENNWSGDVQIMQKYPNVHYSEWAWCGMPEDGIIHNDDSLVDLENKVQLILE